MKDEKLVRIKTDTHKNLKIYAAENECTSLSQSIELLLNIDKTNKEKK